MKQRCMSILLTFALLASLFPGAALAAAAEGEGDYPAYLEQDGSPEEYQAWLDYLAGQDGAPEGYETWLDYLALPPAPVEMDAQPQEGGVVRYTLIMMDNSQSMEGKPMEVMRASALKLCETILETDPNHYIFIGTFSSGTFLQCTPTRDIDVPKEAMYWHIGSVSPIDVGLLFAYMYMVFSPPKIPEGQPIEKNVILMTDGAINGAIGSLEGKYAEKDYPFYKYANTAYEVAQMLTSRGCYLYTLGFYHNLTREERVFPERLMYDMQNAGYYNIVDADDIEFVIGGI